MKNKEDLAAATAAVEKSAKEITEEKKRCKIQIEETDESSSEDEGEAKREVPQSDSQKSKIRYSSCMLTFNDISSNISPIVDHFQTQK